MGALAAWFARLLYIRFGEIAFCGLAGGLARISKGLDSNVVPTRPGFGNLLATEQWVSTVLGEVSCYLARVVTPQLI